jgi:cob(I)alamin adenosyltransferase
MKIYTKGGDKGKSSLFSGERVTKADTRLEAYGTVDELNSNLGMLVVSLRGKHLDMAAEIQEIQSDLLRIGAWLATTPDSPSVESLPQITPERTRFLEAAIDRMQDELPPLMGFILPGGEETAARGHVARSVCRRAERRVVALCERVDAQPGDEVGSAGRASEGGPSRPCEPSPSGSATAAAASAELRVYLNRLSDYLFVLARYCNLLAGLPDTPWEK